MSITPFDAMGEDPQRPLRSDELRGGAAPSTAVVPTLELGMAQVLVVEDDVTLAEVVLGYLERAGHTGRHVADGPSALAAVDAAAPELIVSTCCYPASTGWRCAGGCVAPTPTCRY
jgi:PleD family two-component response regulator